jgi:hypothetical protein
LDHNDNKEEEYDVVDQLEDDVKNFAAAKVEPVSEENLIEFEAALRALTNNILIQNPCPKRTMNLGPKK